MSKDEEVTRDEATIDANVVWLFSQSLVVAAVSYLVLQISIAAGSVPYWDVTGPQLDMMIITLFFNVMLGGSANGLFVAFCQEKILKRAGYQLAYWKRYTTIGFTIGWFAFFMAQYISSEYYPIVGFYESDVLFSSLFGVSVAGLQWLSIRNYYSQAFHWFWTMALSWTVGLYLLVPLPIWFEEYWKELPAAGGIIGLILGCIILSIIHSFFLLIALRLMGSQSMDRQA
jgi:hypothetical protein